MTNLTRVATAIATLVGLCVGSTFGHSFLINPKADWLDSRQPECRIGKPDGPQFDHFAALNCPGPCGETGFIEDRGGFFFSEGQGRTEVQRGQKLYMKWTKNNHFSGFVRFTLVPKSERMNKDVHEKFAFHYACWEAGEIGCDPSDECGTDERRLRYQAEVEIPRVFPDGEYILGWAWYGGSKFIDGSDKAEYGDYWSCANVVISGSADGDINLAVEHTPVFIPGMKDKSKTTCKSAVNKLGVCATEPCYARYEASWQVPAGFENGNTPPPVKAVDVLAITGGDATFNPDSENGNRAENQATDGNGGGNGGNTPTIAIQRVELVNIWDLSVVSQDMSQKIDVSSFKQYLTMRAIVEPIDKVRVVELTVGGVTQREEHPPYYIGGDDNGVPIPWGERATLPLNKDFTLLVRATAIDGSVEESVFYPHFKCAE